ncbi:MAG: cell division protein ZapA [Gemmatimonadota bacterium]
MNEQRASVTVRIAGEEHTIRANAAPEYTRRCAQLVDERIHEIRTKSGLLETHKAAILAALSLADELFQAQEEARKLRLEAASRARNLSARIQDALGRVEAAPEEAE